MNLCSCDTKSAAPVCGCKNQLPAPGPGLSLAIATIPVQPWETPSEPAAGLKQGSIFPSLILPFYKEGGNENV